MKMQGSCLEKEEEHELDRMDDDRDPGGECDLLRRAADRAYHRGKEQER